MARGERARVQRKGKGEWTEFAIPDAQPSSGIASAPDGSLGWIASANIDGSTGSPTRFTGLFGLTGDFDNLLRIPAPAGGMVSDFATGPDGTVYASDPIGGGYYFAQREAVALAVLVAPGSFRSPQGIAVSADGAHLNVSDYRSSPS